VIGRGQAPGRNAQAQPESWGVDTQALRLPANAEVDVRLGAGGRVVRAHRHDIFERLAARGGLEQEGLDAVRRLQEDLAMFHRTVGGTREFAPRVDVQSDPQAFFDIRLEAGARIEAAFARAGAASARLLAALCEPDAVLGQAVDWRAVVERETGERLADAQGAVLRVACANLAAAYRMTDRDRVRARPRGDL
jgi:hypothetical protein